MTIGLIDIKSGNLQSLISAIEKIGLKYKICQKPEDFKGISKVILPGVGAFSDFMNRLKDKNLDTTIRNMCDQNIPFLGICVGYQVIFEKSYEHKITEGLGLLKGSFQSLNTINKKIKTPHVGWNNCSILKESKIFDGIKNDSDFYFDHSYFLESQGKNYFLTETNYEIKFISSINYRNIYGVQFHPEKSQHNGLKFLKNFCEFC
jgi:imidazole glycerol-phosphate synthase subunit HisH